MADGALVKTLRNVKEGDRITVTTVDGVKILGEVFTTMEQPLSCKFEADDETKQRVDSDLQEIDLVKQVEGGPVVVHSVDVGELYGEVEKIVIETSV